MTKWASFLLLVQFGWSWWLLLSRDSCSPPLPMDFRCLLHSLPGLFHCQSPFGLFLYGWCQRVAHSRNFQQPLCTELLFWGPAHLVQDKYFKPKLGRMCQPGSFFCSCLGRISAWWSNLTQVLGCPGEVRQGSISAPQVCTRASGTQSCTGTSIWKEIFSYSAENQAGASPIRLFQLLEI